MEAEEGEWKKKFLDMSEEISLERKILLKETGKLHDACVLAGIVDDLSENGEDLSTKDVVTKATSETVSVYANYIVQTRLNKVKKHICLTMECIRKKNDEIKELKDKIKELVENKSIRFPVEDKPIRLTKQKPLPPVRKISREIQRDSNHVTASSKEEEVTSSFFRPRAATYSNGSSTTQEDTKLSLPKSPKSDPNLTSQEKSLFREKPLFNSPRIRRRSGLSMIQAGNVPDKVLSGVNLKEVHFSLPGAEGGHGDGGCHGDGGKSEALSSRRKFSHPSQLESYPSEKV